MLVVMDRDRYRLGDVIGSGGMATVWRAHDTRLDRVVAVKRPHPAPAGSTTLARFAREARAAATVNHPNLVAVYDVGEDDRGPYLVMEYVDGPSLAATSVPNNGIARTGAQLASALAALHARGIVHGDVKPANILVAGDGVKLTDFGIARMADETTALTREGVVFATPEYAAPETLESGARTAAGDVYALGAVLHELVTGSRWDRSATVTQAMPPPAWMPVLVAALADDPERRPSAAVLGEDLTRLDREAGAGAATVPMAVTAMPMAATALPPPAAAHVPPTSAGHRASRRTAMVVFAGGLIAIVAIVGVLALTDDGGGASTFSDLSTVSGTATSVQDDSAVAEPTVPAPPESPIPPPATEAPTTAAATVPPTSAAPVTTPFEPGRAEAQSLVDLIAEEVARRLDRDDAVEMVEKLNDALDAAEAGRTDDIERALRDVRRRIDRHIDGDNRGEAIDRLVTLAVALGVDPDNIVDGDRDRDRDDDDDDD
jgi:serine/threonine protein kinase